MKSRKNFNELSEQDRWSILRKIDALTDKPMLVLSFIWLGIAIIDLVRGLNRTLDIIGFIIWGLFIIDFVIEIIIAPKRHEYFKKNWIVALSIILPAFRIFVIFRALGMFRLASLIASIRRGAHALSITLHQRGFYYVLALTILVTFAGAAGMAYFESSAYLAKTGHFGETGLKGYDDALWWTAMVMTTMGSGYWPHSIEGRILGWLLAVYAFTVFGYITATIASYFIKIDMGKI